MTDKTKAYYFIRAALLIVGHRNFWNAAKNIMKQVLLRITTYLWPFYEEAGAKKGQNLEKTKAKVIPRADPGKTKFNVFY